ncbi:MAG: alpha-amylase family protein, partial [Chloroflexota bacterium]
MTKLRFRQVHLDFHTSEWCENVGGDFNGDEFAGTLEAARVNSINIFAKCHHGYSYYPTKVGTPHPHLKRDLLGEQIEALHKRDIKCPVYVSILWDELAGKTHPEWVMVDKEGKMISRPPLSNAWGWTTMDVSSSYGDYVEAQVEELINLYPLDGLWFDICFPLPNYSMWGKEQMRVAGVNVEDDGAVWAFARKKQTNFFNRLSTFVHKRLPEALIFYNGTIHPDVRRVAPFMTHLEVESLPTTSGWGYLHYPIYARQARTLGMEFLGMNGRFHGSWGDFGGLKTHDQFDYECGTILAAGGKICVGDQLHPSGKLDAAVYRMIGHTFERVEALEPWLEDAKATAEIALLAVNALDVRQHGNAEYPSDIEGAAQTLLELGYQFDVVDAEADLAGYRAVMLPDGVALSDALVSKVTTYLDEVGRLILSGTAALDAATNNFQLPQIPVRYVEPAPTVPSYLRPTASMIGSSELADDYDYAFYERAHVVQAGQGTTSHGVLSRALFNRTWDHFMGHQHAPVGASLNAPVAVSNEQVLYLAAPLFSGFKHVDYWAYREMIRNLLTDFLPDPLVKSDGPGWAEFSLTQQPQGDDRPARSVVHVVTYHPRRS